MQHRDTGRPRARSRAEVVEPAADLTRRRQSSETQARRLEHARRAGSPRPRRATARPGTAVPTRRAAALGSLRAPSRLASPSSSVETDVRGIGNLFEVVEEHEESLVSHELDQAGVGCRATPRSHARPASGRGAPATGPRRRRPGTPRPRRPRVCSASRVLPLPAGAGERQEPTRAEERSGLVELARPPDEPGRLGREVRSVERPQRREVVASELVESLRRAEILESVLTEIAQLHARVEQLPRRLRDDHLPAVPRAHDPRGAVHVGAHVSLGCDDRLARVDADPHPHRASRQLRLDFSCGCDGVTRALEREEERVALRVDLDPAVARERGAHDSAVLREHVGVAVAKLVEQASGALNVREEERHGSARKLGHRSHDRAAPLR